MVFLGSPIVRWHSRHVIVILGHVPLSTPLLTVALVVGRGAPAAFLRRKIQSLATLPKKSSNRLKINRHTKLFSDTRKHIVKEFAK